MAIKNIRLTYLNGRGKGQMIRILLKYLNVEFQDIVVDSISDELRKKLPYGQVPILEVTLEDGSEFLLAQCNSICRYIADLYNFSGDTFEKRAISEEVVNGVWDLIVSVFSAKDNEAINKLNSIIIPKFFNSFENKLTKNKFISGQDPTYGDLILFTAIDYIDFLGCEFDLSNYPKLQQLKLHFDSIPSIIEYKKKLPDSKF